MFVAKRKFKNLIQVNETPERIERLSGGFKFTFAYSILDEAKSNFPLSVKVYLSKTIADVESLLTSTKAVPISTEKIGVSSFPLKPNPAKRPAAPRIVSKPSKPAGQVNTRIAIQSSLSSGVDPADTIQSMIASGEVTPAGVERQSTETEIGETKSQFAVFDVEFTDAEIASLDNLKFTVAVLSSKDVPLQIQQIDFAKNDVYDYFRHSITPPKASWSASRGDGYGIAELEQTDPKAKSILVYRRAAPLNVVCDASFVLVRDVPCTTKDGPQRIIVDSHPSSNVAYRFLSTDEFGNVSNDFSSIVVEADEPARTAAAPVVTLREDVQYTKILIDNIPATAVDVILKVVEGIQGPTAERLVGKEFCLGKQNIEFKDYKAIDGYFRYFETTFIHRNGDATKHLSPVEKCVKKREGVGSIQITNLSTLDGVSFEMATTLEKSQYETLRSLLIKSGYDSVFSDEIFQERERLSRLIVHKVIRRNLTTGAVVDFGAFEDKFVDVDSSIALGVEPALPGQKYRYQILSCVRAPETLFQDFKKKSIDKATGREYQWKPSVFLHPLATNQGVITTESSRLRLTAYSEMEQNPIGCIEEFQVEIQNAPGKILSARERIISTTQKYLVVTFTDVSTLFDHFQVTKEGKSGLRSVGRIFQAGGQTEYKFTVDCEPDDKFYIMGFGDQGSGEKIEFTR